MVTFIQRLERSGRFGGSKCFPAGSVNFAPRWAQDSVANTVHSKRGSNAMETGHANFISALMVHLKAHQKSMLDSFGKDITLQKSQVDARIVQIRIKCNQSAQCVMYFREVRS